MFQPSLPWMRCRDEQRCRGSCASWSLMVYCTTLLTWQVPEAEARTANVYVQIHTKPLYASTKKLIVIVTHAYEFTHSPAFADSSLSLIAVTAQLLRTTMASSGRRGLGFRGLQSGVCRTSQDQGFPAMLYSCHISPLHQGTFHS